MNKEKIEKFFAKWAKEAGADYAIVDIDGYGDCNSCVNSELSSTFGRYSTGVYLKHFEHGMNAFGPIEEENHVYVGHNITEEQAEKFISIMSEEFQIFPKKYNPYRTFALFDKDTDVYKVSWSMKEPEDLYFEEFLTQAEAEMQESFLKSIDYCSNIRKEKCI